MIVLVTEATALAQDYELVKTKGSDGIFPFTWLRIVYQVFRWSPPLICLVIMVNAFWRLYRCDKYAQNKISNLKISIQVIAFGAYVLSCYI